MRVINFGSLNIDHVYRVERFAKPGETLASTHYQQFVGGKGLNQSIALARAGAKVMHAGSIGADGATLKSTLEADGVDVSCVFDVDGPSGHAIIQVDSCGENCILLHGGANQRNGPETMACVFGRAKPGDLLLLQNEINDLPAIIQQAAERQLQVVFNPAPMSNEVLRYPLHKVDYLILNQTEAAALTAQQGITEILAMLRERFAHCKVVLTQGADGAVYQDQRQKLHVDAVAVRAIDTTAAGDTFVGYFLAELCRGSAVKTCLQIACRAAALCVQKAGAANSIPYRHQLEER